MVLWLKVTQDKYELPMVVADSPKELARIVGTTAHNIHSTITHHKRAMDHRVVCPYVRVEIEEDD